MSEAMARTGLTDRTVEGIREALAGRPRWSSPLLFAGPAVIASIAYMDPGNFATNIQAGAKYGYTLLWVVLIANVVAMLFQALSAKLGIVTGRNLAELCRDAFSAAGRLGAVDRQRSRGDGDRPRRIPRRRHRPVAVAAYSAARRHGHHRDADLRNPDVRRTGVSPDRAHHRRARRRHRRSATSPRCSSRQSTGARRRSTAWLRCCRTPAR